MEKLAEPVRPPVSAGWRRACLSYALLSVLLAWSWQCLTVHFNFGGNWTALYHAGVRRPIPPSLASEDVYRFPRTFGYDAQFYHYIAHSPFSAENFAPYMDGPSLRWRRILIPASAYGLAFGHAAWVDPAFLVVTLSFLFLGSYWLSAYAVLGGRHPAWGLGYLLVPATMIAVERLTIDMALVTLCVGYALYAEARSPWKILPILMAAPLVRETGLLLCASHALFSAWKRRWGRAVLALAASVPFFLWAAYVDARVLPDGTRWTNLIPLFGLYHRTLRPVVRWMGGTPHVIAAALDYLAVLGVWVAIVLVLYLLWKRRHWQRQATPVVVALTTFTLAIAFVANPKVWAEAYAFGRLVSPILVWLAMLGLSERRWWLGLPLLLFVPRVSAQLATHLPGIVKGMLGM